MLTVWQKMIFLRKIERGTVMKKKVILVVSFGTSYQENCEVTIGAIERAIANAFGEYEVRRAFTSQMILNKLKKSGIVIDNVKEALQKLVAENVSEVVVQPTHLMNGIEYDKLMAQVETYRSAFERLVVGEPLLTSEKDFVDMMSVMTQTSKCGCENIYNMEETAMVFMGHGSEHEANTVYAKLQSLLFANGYRNYLVGTVEATPDVNDVITLAKGYRNIVLQPLMVVAGDHANNDMASDEEDSWKSQFERAGFEVTCLVRGLGELPAIQEMYVRHVNDARENK